MLSYRHAFHAGGYADVLKHAILVHVLCHVVRKPKPVYVLDTHAGAGSYALDAPMARKTGEYRTGIARALSASTPAPDLLAPYLALVRAANPADALRRYPGSPALARSLLRPQDRLELVELHGTDHGLLAASRAGAPREQVVKADGLAHLVARMPPPERRAVALIDPSYEIKTDYQTVVEAVAAAHRRFPSGTYLLWYPVIKRVRTERMLDALRATGIRRQFRVELGLVADAAGRGMTAAGIVAINPPWTLPHAASAGLPWLAKALGATGPLAAAWLAPPEA